MKSKIDFRCSIDDDSLDESGSEIMTMMIGTLSKLASYEVSAGPERDIGMASELADIIERCQNLKTRYDDNLLDKQQIEVLKKELP